MCLLVANIPTIAGIVHKDTTVFVKLFLLVMLVTMSRLSKSICTRPGGNLGEGSVAIST